MGYIVTLLGIVIYCEYMVGWYLVLVLYLLLAGSIIVPLHLRGNSNLLLDAVTLSLDTIFAPLGTHPLLIQSTDGGICEQCCMTETPFHFVLYG